MTFRFVVIALLAISICISKSTHANDDQLPQIRKKLAEYYSTPNSFEAICTWARPNPLGAQSQFVWCEDGARKLMQTTYRSPQSTEYRFVLSESVVDRIRYLVAFWPEDGNRDKLKAITTFQDSALPAAYYDNECAASLGWYVRGANRKNLAELARSPDCRVLGEEVLFGSSCLHLDFGHIQTVDGDGSSKGRLNHLECWLDPALNYLPRRIQVAPCRYLHTPEGVPIKPTASVDFLVQAYVGFFEVLEYQQLDDPILGQRRFPKRIRQGGEERNDINVDVKVLNTPIPRDRFVPVAHSNCELITISKSGAMNVEYAGGVDGKKAYEAKQLTMEPHTQRIPPSWPKAVATPISSADATPINATPPTSPLSRWILVSSVAVLGIALWLWKLRT